MKANHANENGNTIINLMFRNRNENYENGNNLINLHHADIHREVYANHVHCRTDLSHFRSPEYQIEAK